MAFELLRRGRVVFDQHEASELVDLFLKTLPRKESLGAYDPVEVVTHIEAAHGLLIHETSDFLAFSHLTIHEYFAARYLIDSSNERILQTQLTFATISNPQWREVILLAAGLLASADYLLLLMRRALCQALSNEPTLRRIFEALRDPDKYEAIRVWGATVIEAKFDERHAELVSGITLLAFHNILQTRLDSIVEAVIESGSSQAALRYANTMRHNLLVRDLKYAYTYMCEGPKTRRDTFFATLYAEELFTTALTTARVGARGDLERSIFFYTQ
jgi:hypothetical protein